MLSRFGISARIFGGFAAIIVLLAIIVVASFFGVQSLSTTFSEYRAATAQTSEIGDYVKDFNALVLAEHDYRAHPVPDKAEEVIVWVDDVATNDAEGLAKFESMPEALEIIHAIEADAAAYKDAFVRLMAVHDERAVISGNIGETEIAFRDQLKVIFDAAREEGDFDVAIGSGVNAQQVMLMQQAATRYVQTHDDADFEQIGVYAALAEAGFDEVLETTTSFDLSDEILVIDQQIANYGELIARLRENIKLEEQIQTSEIGVLAARLHAQYEELSAMVRAQQDELGPRGEQAAGLTMLVVLGVGTGAMVIGIVLAILIGRWLSRAIRNMSANMRRLADGDLDLELTGAEQRNELGQMAQALQVFQSNGQAMRAMDAEKEQERKRDEANRRLHDAMQAEVARVVAAAADGDFSARITETYNDKELDSFTSSLNNLMTTVDTGLSETGNVMSAMANADMTRRVKGDYRGAFDKLKADTNAVADKLSEVVRQLRETSRGVKAATGEILSGANDLSQRTTKQAATIEETSAAMEQLSNTVMDNAKAAEAAADKTQTAARMAQQGGEVMSQANEAMERITSSSEKISNIIGMIDDIAFQTNLLALNASVEAARAGEAGKGFAVVAVEVRRLAQSAAQASSEVKALIEQSGSEVGEGSKLVSSAAGKLEEMLKAVQENSDLMQSISSASRQQSSSIEEVAAAVRQMDEMTQHNAALVEQTNAAIEQTEAQASELDKIIEIFRIDDAGRVEVEASAPKKGIKALQEKVTSAAKTYLSKGNAAVDVDKDWAEF